MASGLQMYTVQLCHRDRAASSPFHRLKIFKRKQSLTAESAGRYQPQLSHLSRPAVGEKLGFPALPRLWEDLCNSWGGCVQSRYPQSSCYGAKRCVDFTDSGGDNGNSQFVTSTLIQHRAPDNIGIFVGLFLDQ